MSPKYDADLEELNTGPIRFHSPRHFKKNPKPQQVSHTGKYCLDCGKQGHASIEAAREVIGNAARLGRLTAAGSYAIHPYLCPHGWWHVGRNRYTICKLNAFFAKRLGQCSPFPAEHPRSL